MDLFNRKKVKALTERIIKLENQLALILDVNASYGKGLALVDDKVGCEIIIFSKDRAMQLHALLSSYFYFVSNTAPIQILYTCSSVEHQKSYDDLIQLFKDKNVSFVKETDFKPQLLGLLGNIKTSKMFFMTDDALFIDYLDLNDFSKFNTQNTVPSLSKGNDLTFCFAFNKAQDLPVFLNIDALDPKKLVWEWNLAVESPDWAYPLSVDGSLFTTSEILKIMAQTDFKAPNSLESNLQEFLPLFINRYGVGYDKVKYVNVPCNIVQKEWVNNATNAMDVEFLLQKWNEGKRIHFEEFNGTDVKIVQMAVFNFVDRS
ncbi:hypothetical protein D3C87_178060 [compost metagenome]